MGQETRLIFVGLIFRVCGTYTQITVLYSDFAEIFRTDKKEHYVINSRATASPRCQALKLLSMLY